jgi:serine/threonine-protein kinase
MLPASLASRYRARRQLGRGGFGVVVEAEDVATGRAVAVKLLAALDRVELERFQREARMLAQVHHPGVVRILDVGVASEGQPYLVMELIPGGRIARQIPDLRELVDFVDQVAEALDELHGLGLVHRDLKPGNLLTREDGTVVLADFGLARTIQAGSTVTQEGIVVGTPQYMAPELWDDFPASPASDQFSLAAVACRLLTGEGVYPDGAPLEVGRAALVEGARLPPAVPVALRAVLGRAIERDPSRRFPSCGAFAVAVRSAARVDSDGLARRAGHTPTRPLGKVAVPRAPTGETTGRRRRRAWLPAGTKRIVAVLAGAVAVGFLSVAPAPPDPSPVPLVPASPEPAPAPTPPGRPRASFAEISAHAARVHAATQRMAATLRPGYGGDLSGLGGQSFRRGLARHPEALDDWEEAVGALGAWLDLAPPVPIDPPGLREVRFGLRMSVDTSKILGREIRANFLLSRDEQRALGPLVTSMRVAGETALAPTLERPHPPERVVVLGSLLLLAGYPDPSAMFDRVRAAAAEARIGQDLGLAVLAVAVSIDEVSALDELPCVLRRAWLRWILKCLVDPDLRPAFPQLYHWASVFTKCFDSGVTLQQNRCYSDDDGLDAALVAAVQELRRRLGEGPAGGREEFQPLAVRLRDLIEQAQMGTGMGPALEALEEVLGPDTDGDGRPEWQRDLE